MKRKKGQFLSKKTLCFLFLLPIVLVLCLSIAGVLFSAFLIRTLEHNIDYRMTAVSKLASQLATVDELDQYRTVDDMSLPSYQVLRHKLKEFAEEYEVLYVYYIRRVGDLYLQYIIDSDFNEKTRVGLDTPPYGLLEEPWIKKALEEKTSQSSGLGNYTPNWPGLLTTYTPLFDKDGNVKVLVGVDIQDKPILFAERMFNILAILRIIIIAVLLISGFIALFHYRIAAQKAIEASAAKSTFLANMSHEFRTPLNAVLGMSELIRRTSDPEQVLDYTNEITTAGQSLLFMVDNLLEYSNTKKS